MHILPLILATWSYKQRVEEAIEREKPTLIGDGMKRGQIESFQDNKPRSTNVTEMSIMRQNNTGLTTAERNSVRYDRVADPIDYSKQGTTNEITGSHFMKTELCHVGTDAWGSLKNRLAENGIRINDDDVAIMAAGFHAEMKLQEMLGHSDRKALKDELEGDVAGEYWDQPRYDARWVRDINAHPDAEAIALECFEDLKKHYPAALGVDMRSANQAIGFDQNVIEVES